MVDLGSLGGTYSVARDVNESGTVVGTSAVAPGDPAFHAFVWTSAAGMRDLGTLGGTDSEAYAVSDTGQVVGRSLTPGDAAWHAFAWTPSSGMVDLVPLSGYTDSIAYLVNSSGAVVGRVTTASPALIAPRCGTLPLCRRSMSGRSARRKAACAFSRARWTCATVQTARSSSRG